LLAYLPRESQVAYGDRVQVFGRLVSPPDFDEFSYGDYLARQKVFSLMPGADVTVLATGGGNPVYRALLDLKKTSRQRINQALEEPQASLLVGILLGDDSGLSEDTENAFTRVGASHMYIRQNSHTLKHVAFVIGASSAFHYALISFPLVL